jgi:hypothetical protein
MIDGPSDPGLDDYELQPTPAGPPPRTPRSALPWVIAVIIVVVLAAGYYVMTSRQRTTPASASSAPPAAPSQSATPAAPLGANAEPIALPPLDETDPVVRDLVRRLTSNPQVAAWLATKGLIRNFVVVVSNVADGRSPSPQLSVLRPKTRFRIVDRDGVLSIDPRSCGRYDALADAVASIDPAGAARLYTMLKPRIDDAYRELGYPDTPFDRTLERALVALLGTPVAGDSVQVVAGRGGYQFADADLERLSGAQKQLVRTGPRNERLIQSSLRQIALALGIPPERLPAER